ncbi:MAG TPA: hypothetical protein VD815_10800 [Candidatus Saccharimonadales bacterium]|nr:hypothetical protein [Candidatus Saccharimonadales bacterium]
MTDSKPVGLSFISDNLSNTIDSFWMIIYPNTLISPFDFVTVENVNETTTIGIVKEIKRIFLNLESLPNLRNSYELKTALNQQDGVNAGFTVANVDVISNFPSVNNKTADSDDTKVDLNKALEKVKSPTINMPVQEGKFVYFAKEEEVRIALGIPEMENPIPAGLITLTNGTRVPIDLDVSYLFGPDTTHVNASGISGNMKTGYLLFLLQVIHKKLEDDGVSIIMFNTKEKDLLSVDKKREKELSEDDKQILDSLDVELSPFQNVKYFLPRGKNGSPNAAYVPEKNAMTYSYELSDVYDRLDLLFSSDVMVDPRHNVSAILNYIYETWPANGQNGEKEDKGQEQQPKDQYQDLEDLKQVGNWSDLIKFDDYPEEIITHKSTLLKFQGMVQRFRRPATLFVDKKVTSTYLGKEIRRMKKNEVLVIDIARLSTLEEQAFVVGDVIKTIDEMYSIGSNISTAPAESTKQDVNSKMSDETQGQNKKPKYVVILLDEINRFLPHREGGGANSVQGSRSFAGGRSAVGEELFKTLITGKSRHCILFSAQQFKSQIDPGINENTGLHILAKLGLSELSTSPYSMIDDVTKSVISKLNKGEFILVHSAFRHPIKITIPKPTFKKL